MRGRFAPSPTGRLHVGNLRTGLLAWLVSRSAGGGFLVRMEDLDAATSAELHEAGQLADLAAMGIDHDGPIVRQRERRVRYEAAIADLIERDLTYECFCTRREIRLEIERAVNAPHADRPDGAYPGTCRGLSATERAERRRDRSPALRLRAGGARLTVHDELAADHTGCVDDFVLRRNDGLPAYNLAVVVDDAAQGVDVVVRGDDLLSSTPRQVFLQHLLGLPTPRYVHVPLVLGPDGERLAKRHGAVTLDEMVASGVTTQQIRAALVRSLGVDAPADATPGQLVERFDLAAVRRVGRRPVVLAELERSWS